MPTYGFKCDTCGNNEDVFMSMEEYCEGFECAKGLGNGKVCEGVMMRSWSSPTISRIDGCGQSPTRFPSV